MKRVATELQSKAASEKDPAMDYMLLQGVRFAFRIHQVCFVGFKSLLSCLCVCYLIVYTYSLFFVVFFTQFAGGFDAETMHAFEELRNLAHLLNKK